MVQMATEYALQKEAATMHDVTLIDLQKYYSLSNDIPSPATFNYAVLDQVCDKKDTLLNVISELRTEFIFEGDQVTYQHLQSIG